MDEINKSKLTTDQQAQLEIYQQNEEQLKTLGDIAAIVQDISSGMNEDKQKKSMEKLGALLVDIRETLKATKAKEAPETPDFAKPVVEAVSKLERALSASLKAIDVKPQVNVSAPNVNVDAPVVDLSGVEKALKTLPTAFNSAIKLIPKTEIPKEDYTPLLKAWEGISEQLLSIETATRLKPQFPTSLKVTNANGTEISDVNLKQSNTIKFASISASSAGDNTIVALVDGKKIKVLSCILVSNGTVSVKWRSNTTDISGLMPLVANSGFVLPASSPGQGHYLETVAGEALNINLSGAVGVYGHITYFEES